MAVEIEVKVEGTDSVAQAMRNVLGHFKDPATRRRIAQAAAPVVVGSIQSISPVSKAKHYRYNTPKLVGRLRAPNGYGRKVAEYLPGNLAKSVMDLGERRKRFREGPAVVIGPIYTRSKSYGPFGKGKQVDGYYAHMAMGNALAYQKRVLIAGMKGVQGIALRNMIREAAAVLREQKLKNGLE